MVRLQLLSGARPGEMVILRPCDIDMSGKVWLYRPELHKNSWRGHERTILFGGAKSETWIWDGIEWSVTTPTPSPPPRSFPMMVYDPIRRGVLLIGGESGNDELSDV